MSTFEMMEKPSIGQELLDVPMGDMIRQMAFAIADAQIKLDANSIEVAKMMGGLTTIYDQEGNVSFSDSRVFFGRDKMSLDNAIELHNSSNDAELKTQIKQVIDADVTGTTTLSKRASATNKDVYIPARLSMLELGFSPTFYQFVDTIIEVKISIKFTQSGSSYSNTRTNDRTSTARKRGLFQLVFGGKTNSNVTATQVNSGHSQKYSYSAEGASILRTKLVPIPPPAILEERIRQNMEATIENPIPAAQTT